jgi:hypothetical protein
LTWHALGVWEDDSDPGFTAAQREVTVALRTVLEKHEFEMRVDEPAAKLKGWYSELRPLAADERRLKSEMASLEERGTSRLSLTDGNRLKDLQVQATSPGTPEDREIKQLLWKAIQTLPPADRETYQKDSISALELKARFQTISLLSVPVLKQLQDSGVDVSDFVSRASTAGSDEARAAAVNDALDYINKKLNASAKYSKTRHAAADEMLKEMTIAVEDDLARLFIQPMIRNLRKRLISEAKVNVGILQRESLLATNRGKARIDPRASAQLAVGEEEDILSGVQQLAQLYGAIQSGGALAFFGALQKQPREQQPEIYALTTGNKFEVTPIFDPSGQALRFKFDFVGTSHVQEPNGTTNPQLPQIERHTVNTEVQLTNLETREISRFESDARLGLPTRYWGGLPILKDIPYVRPWVPLVGWFVRKAGSNAVAQQSVIFGQTTIYPTIDPIVDLLQGPEPPPNRASLHAAPAAPKP